MSDIIRSIFCHVRFIADFAYGMLLENRSHHASFLQGIIVSLADDFTNFGSMVNDSNNCYGSCFAQ